MATQGQQCVYTDLNGNAWPAVIIEATAAGNNCALLVFGSPGTYQVSSCNQGSGNGTWAATSSQLQAANYTVVAAGTATATVIKATPGTYYGIVGTTSAANPATVFDNASAGSGNTLGGLIANAGVNASVLPAVGVKAANGITLAGSATNPAVTIYWT